MANQAETAKPSVSADQGSLLHTIANLWAYMWPAQRPDLKRRVLYALAALLVAKAASSLAPFAYKAIIDSLGVAEADQFADALGEALADLPAA